MTTKEQRREYSRSWAAKNPEKVKESKRRYVEKNAEKIRARKNSKRAAESEKLKAAKRAWEKANPDIVSMQRARRRIRLMNAATNRDLRYHYDITVDKYKEVAGMQGDVCLICGQKSITARIGRLVVDHCHGSGVLRGLLCHRCNCGLGYFKDNVDMVARALKYLEAFSVASADKAWPDRVAEVIEQLDGANEFIANRRAVG